MNSGTDNLKGWRRSGILDAVLVILAALAFHWIYWDKFLAPSSSGMFFHTAELILEGKAPYRDFFQIVPPLHPLKIAALIEMFGRSMQVVRFEALLERTILAVMVMFWLRRIATPASALGATLLGIAIFASDPADPLASYHHDSVFWAVAAGLSATLCFERSARESRLPAFAAGFASACSLCTKHTTGLGVTTALGFLFFWLDRQQGRRWQSVRYFAAGWSVPILLMTLWLTSAGVGVEFFRSLLASSGAKGSGVSLYLRPLVQMWPLSLAAIACLAIGSRFKGSRSLESPSTWWIAAPALGACGFILAAPQLLSGLHLSAPWFPSTLILIGLLGCGWIGTRMLLRILSGETLDQHHQALMFLSVTGFSAAYMLGLSWAAYGPMALPSLACVVAIGLDRASAYGRTAMVSALGVTLAIFSAQAHEKARLPFSWMGWDETALGSATEESSSPFAAKLHITPETHSAFDGVTRVITARAQKNSTLLAYPYMPMFYTSTGLRAPTYTFNHYLDVTPDWVVDRDVRILKATPPDFLIVLPDSTDALSPLEEVFRAGLASSTRRIAGVIAELTPGKYKLIGRFEVPRLDRTLGPAQSIEVWEKTSKETVPSELISTYKRNFK